MMVYPVRLELTMAASHPIPNRTPLPVWARVHGDRRGCHPAPAMVSSKPLGLRDDCDDGLWVSNNDSHRPFHDTGFDPNANRF